MSGRLSTIEAVGLDTSQISALREIEPPDMVVSEFAEHKNFLQSFEDIGPYLYYQKSYQAMRGRGTKKEEVIDD